MPGYSVEVCAVSDLDRSTTLPLSASSGSAAGSWPRITLGSVPDLIAATSFAVLWSAVARYCPRTLIAECVLLNCVWRYLISVWVPELQNVTVTGPLPDEPDPPDELHAVAASPSSKIPAMTAGRPRIRASMSRSG